MVMMKGFGLIAFLLILSVVYLDAFVPPKVHSSSNRLRQSRQASSLQPVKTYFKTTATTGIRQRKAQNKRNKLQSRLSSSSSSSSNEIDKHDDKHDAPFTHADIVWRLKPSRDLPLWKRIWLKIAANLIRLDCLIRRQEAPLVLCPKGGQALLEAYGLPKKSIFPWRRRTKIGRFGFTTMAGPSNVPIQETVHDLYELDVNRPYRVGAIIYMFVEEEFRKVSIVEKCMSPSCRSDHNTLVCSPIHHWHPRNTPTII